MIATNLRTFTIFAGLLVSCQALAFGGRMGYGDPSSRIGNFFTDSSRADRAAPNWSELSPTKLQTRWLDFQAKIRTKNFVTCEEWRRCDASKVAQWLDWDLWYRLNADAAELWEAMVACAENQDPERARIAYFHAKSFCPNDSRQDATLRARLLSLHGQVRDFVNSTNVEWIDEYRDQDIVRVLRTIVPSHPLFAQVITEYAATIARFHKRRWSDVGPVAHDDSWIDGRYGRAFGSRVDAVLNGSSTAISDRYLQARAFVNIHLILGFLPNTNADAPGWGLWREGSTLLAALISQQMVISHGASSSTRSSAHLSFGARNPFSKEEGDPSQILLPELLLREEASVVTEYRAMAERYGLLTYRYKLCARKPLIYNICFALDPSNPDETMDGF